MQTLFYCGVYMCLSPVVSKLEEKNNTYILKSL